MTLPALYQRRLQRAYPQCRMRWSNVRQKWQFEVRANYPRLDINPAKYPREAVDTFICHRDGFYREREFEPNELPQIDKFIQFLRARDVRRLGYGPEDGDRLAGDLDAQDAAEQAAKYASAKREFVETGADLKYERDTIRSVVPANATGLDS